MIKNPFRRNEHSWIALCDCCLDSGENLNEYNRINIESNLKNDPYQCQLSFKQEFSILNSKTNKPYGWSEKNNLKNYHGVIDDSLLENRSLIDKIIDNIMYAGIELKNIISEKFMGKWSFSIKRTNVLNACDSLVLLRYIIFYSGIKENVNITFKHDALGNLHQNKCYFLFSTKNIRHQEDKIDAIDFCEKLKVKHLELKLHPSNIMATAVSNFTYGVDDIDYSINIYNDYIQDNRFLSSSNPYDVTWKLLKVALWQTLEFIPRTLKDTSSRPVSPIHLDAEPQVELNKKKVITESGLGGLLNIITNDGEEELNEIDLDFEKLKFKTVKIDEEKRKQERKEKNEKDMSFVNKMNFDDSVKENMKLLKNIQITRDVLKSDKTPKNINEKMSSQTHVQDIHLNDEFSQNAPFHLYGESSGQSSNSNANFLEPNMQNPYLTVAPHMQAPRMQTPRMQPPRMQPPRMQTPRMQSNTMNSYSSNNYNGYGVPQQQVSYHLPSHLK